MGIYGTLDDGEGKVMVNAALIILGMFFITVSMIHTFGGDTDASTHAAVWAVLSFVVAKL